MALKITIDLGGLELVEDPEREGVYTLGPAMEAKVIDAVAANLIEGFGRKNLVNEVSDRVGIQIENQVSHAVRVAIKAVWAEAEKVS